LGGASERAVVEILPRQRGAVQRCLGDSPELWRRVEDHAKLWLLWIPPRLSQLTVVALKADYDDDDNDDDDDDDGGDMRRMICTHVWPLE